ncbi:MAG: lytic transglycosylase domain-containing protein [Salinivirgaceae bacterium]|nr:lytic transglycosylase domain-containing protein [Salinivirgaceae bacterium]
MRKSTIVLLFLLTIIVSGAVSYVVSRYASQANVQPQQTTDIDEFPDNLTFMGEPVPIHNFDVREALDRELQVNRLWHSQTILLLKRANRYFPVIEPILKRNNVPDDLKYIAVIESALTNAVSPSGAKGFWQFLQGTAGDFGLEVNDEVDERYNLEKSTIAAVRYFKKMKDKFGSWTMSAAAYNVGRNNLIKFSSQQKSGNYYDLVLGEETERYVFRAIAVKQIFENPQKYGFYIPDSNLYKPLPYKTVVVDTAIPDIADFARAQGTNYKMLKVLNPWLRSTKLTNSKRKSYKINILDPAFREIVFEDTTELVLPVDLELN